MVMYFRAGGLWFLLLVVLPLAACGGRNQPRPAEEDGTAERIMEEETRLLREATTLFTGIKNPDSAQEARPKLDKLRQRLTELNGVQQGLGPDEKLTRTKPFADFTMAYGKCLAECARVQVDVPEAKETAKDWLKFLTVLAQSAKSSVKAKE